MRANLLTTLIVGLAASSMTACGKKDEADDNKSKDPITLEMPAKGSGLNLVKMSELRAGNYKLTNVTTYFEGTEDDISGGFEHTLKTPGDFDDDDKVTFSVDWGSLDKSEEVFYITQELNVPQSMQITGGKIEFRDNRYYWNQIRGDKSWAWSASGEESPRGARIDRLFTEGKLKNGAYTNAAGLYNDEQSSRGQIVQTAAGEVQFFVEIKHTDRKRIIRITYKQ